MKRPIITIDGPAASGKSTTAQQVARYFNYDYIDTGAMYRAVTLKALHMGISPDDVQALAELVAGTQIIFQQVDGAYRVFLDGIDVTEGIRSPEVTERVSAVSAVKQVRKALVARQRELGRNGGVVMEGRDIGTVVFPEAEVKIFMVADRHERARRRTQEIGENARPANVDDVEQAILKRDTWDSSRANSPLRQARDAYLLDTGSLTVQEQVQIVIDIVETHLGPGRPTGEHINAHTGG